MLFYSCTVSLQTLHSNRLPYTTGMASTEHACTWLLGGFLASGIHRQCAFLPSHKATISMLLVPIFAARWHLSILLLAVTYSLFHYVNYLLLSIAPSGSAADGESVFTIWLNPKYEANSAGCMLCLICCYYNWKKYARHRYYSADICQYKSM